MSDMTRMLFFGRPDRKVTHMYKAVLKAQLAAIDAVRAGVTAGQVDRKARQVFGIGRAWQAVCALHRAWIGPGNP